MSELDRDCSGSSSCVPRISLLLQGDVLRTGECCSPPRETPNSMGLDILAPLDDFRVETDNIDVSAMILLDLLESFDTIDHAISVGPASACRDLQTCLFLV